MTFGLMTKFGFGKTLFGGKNGAACDKDDGGHNHGGHHWGHGGPKDDDCTPDTTDDGGTSKLPAIAADTSGITFHLDLTGDSIGDENIYVDADDLNVDGDATFEDYFAKLQEEVAKAHPGTDAKDITIKATIYGPNSEESYYHFTGDEFSDDEDCGDDKDDHSDKDDSCDKDGHSKDGHGKDGHGKDSWHKGGWNKGGWNKDDRDDCDDDKDDDKDDCGDGKSGHDKGHDKGGDYWKGAGDFFKSLCKPDDGDQEDDDKDDCDRAEEDESQDHKDPVLC